MVPGRKWPPWTTGHLRPHANSIESRNRGMNLPNSANRAGNRRNEGGELVLGSTPLEARFVKAEPHLNESRKKVLRAILENSDDTFFLSSRELARRYEVDAATIVRTIQALGYQRFAEFAADLRSHFVTRITHYTILKAAWKEKR